MKPEKTDTSGERVDGDDIVTRLRDERHMTQGDGVEAMLRTARDAADEIEQLRVENAMLREALDETLKVAARNEDGPYVDRARAALWKTAPDHFVDANKKAAVEKAQSSDHIPDAGKMEPPAEAFDQCVGPDGRLFSPRVVDRRWARRMIDERDAQIVALREALGGVLRATGEGPRRDAAIAVARAALEKTK